MLIHLFRGPERIFAATTNASGANLPAKHDPWAPFKSIEVTRGGEPVPGLNVEECLHDIETYGFYITDAHVRITDQFV